MEKQKSKLYYITIQSNFLPDKKIAVDPIDDIGIIRYRVANELMCNNSKINPDKVMLYSHSESEYPMIDSVYLRNITNIENMEYFSLYLKIRNKKRRSKMWCPIFLRKIKVTDEQRLSDIYKWK